MKGGKWIRCRTKHSGEVDQQRLDMRWQECFELHPPEVGAAGGAPAGYNDLPELPFDLEKGDKWITWSCLSLAMA